MAQNGETGSPAQLAGHDPVKVEAAVFGREVEDFIDHDRIGQYLIDRAKQDLEEASAKLLCVDPTNATAIALLQLDARVAQRVRGWLSEAIESGRNAAVLLQQEQDEHGN
jgi:ribosomal protein S18 acetylase RimI-like enzyme